MLEFKLMNYLDIVPRLHPGTVYVAWPDLLLFFDAGNLSFDQSGFTVFAHKGTVEYGCGHAVLSLGTKAANERPLHGDTSAIFECHRFLEKPTYAELVEAGALVRLQGEQTVLVDSDFFFDRSSTKLLLAFADDHCAGGIGAEIDSGADILMQLGAAVSKQPVVDTGDVRTQLHRLLRESGLGIHAAVLLPSTFYHVGTMKEYLQYYSTGIPELECLPRIYNAHTRLPNRSLVPSSTGALPGCQLPMQDFDGAAVMQCLLPLRPLDLMQS